MTDTERAIQLHLDAHPEDYQARGVLADHLDEIGDERAAGYRCLGLLRKRPRGFNRHSWLWYTYWPAPEPRLIPNDKSELSRDWWDTMLDRQMSFPSLREATDAAARAFARLTLARQLELLTTTVV